MKSITKSLGTAAVLCVLFSLGMSTAMAANSAVVKIKTVMVQKNTSTATLILPLPTTGTTCATNRFRVSIDISDAIGRSQLATALTAMHGEMNIRIFGTGTCIGSIERVNTILLFDE